MNEKYKEKESMSKVYVMDHPLIQHKVGIIRREEIGSKDFPSDDQ